MKTLHNEYKKFMIKDVTTIVNCFSIEFENGNKLGYTNHTSDIIFIEEPNLIYKSTGFTNTANQKTSSMNVDNLDSDFMIDDIDIKQNDLERGIWNNAKIKYFRCNYSLPFSYNYIEKIQKGIVADITKNKNYFSLEVSSLTQNLQTRSVKITKPTCDAQFCDNQCKLDINNYTNNAVIQYVVTNKEFILETSPSENLENGLIEFTSGDAYLQKIEIKSFDTTTKTLILKEECNYNVQIGDTIKLVDGCDKLKKTCKTKYNNVVNFRGFSFIPSSTEVINFN